MWCEGCIWSLEGGWGLYGDSQTSSSPSLSTPGPQHSHSGAINLRLSPSNLARGFVRSENVTLLLKLFSTQYCQQQEAQTFSEGHSSPKSPGQLDSLPTLCSEHRKFPNRNCFFIPQCLCIGCSLGLECSSPHLHSVDSYYVSGGPRSNISPLRKPFPHTLHPSNLPSPGLRPR